MLLSNQPSQPKQSTSPFVLSNKPSFIPVDEDEPVRKNPFNLDYSKRANINSTPSTPTAEPLDRMKLRRACCGMKLGKEFKHSDGTYAKGTYYCGLWRDNFCPTCARYRARKARALAQKALARSIDNERSLKKITTDESGAKSLCGKLKKGEYQRYPQEDGSYIFLVESDKDVDATGQVEEVSWGGIENIDWDEVIQTPENRRITGSLGRKADAPNEHEATIKKPVFTVHPDTTKEQEIKALKETFTKTANLSPTTPEELEEALKERTEVFIKELKAAGGSLLHRVSFKETKVPIMGISWNKGSTYDLSTIEKMVQVDEEEPEIPLVD